jgi:murein DD-endopeptidase MepM/ murein hydrolase activator NlpD
MKIRIKQAQNRVKQRYSERYYIFSRRFHIWWENFLRKGHEKMTVMFIPHNEKRIFNFQISKFTIGFFAGMFMLIIVISGVAFIKNAAVKRQEEKLLTTYKNVQSQLLHFQKMTYEISDIMRDIKPDIEEIYKISAGTEEIEDIWETLPIAQSAVDNKNKSTVALPEPVYDLQNITNDILNATNTIKTVKNFVDVRRNVVYATPSSVPLEGHITSLFGWRRSPFGFGRDFHTGIDIAAPQNTPIHATAPGTVVMVGWGGGYGNMVRIRHKYGFETIYGHCTSLAVYQGQEIKRDSNGRLPVVGYVGSTGSSTGFHCHYEIRLGPDPINPYPYMSKLW